MIASRWGLRAGAPSRGVTLGDRRLELRARSNGSRVGGARARDGHAGQQEQLRLWSRQASLRVAFGFPVPARAGVLGAFGAALGPCLASTILGRPPCDSPPLVISGRWRFDSVALGRLTDSVCAIRFPAPPLEAPGNRGLFCFQTLSPLPRGLLACCNGWLGVVCPLCAPQRARPDGAGGHVNTTILPPAWFPSIQRCASTISSRVERPPDLNPQRSGSDLSHEIVQRHAHEVLHVAGVRGQAHAGRDHVHRAEAVEGPAIPDHPRHADEPTLAAAVERIDQGRRPDELEDLVELPARGLPRR